MTNFKDYPFQSLQFYATAPYDCSYLPNQEARSQVATPPQLINRKVYDQLINAGFRRSGLFTYRPYCDHCKACIATRIPVNQFTPSRSQRRAWKKYQHLEIRALPLTFSEEHFELYQRYQATRHTNVLEDSFNTPSIESERDQYKQFLLESNIETVLVEFRDQEHLKMVSIIDVLADGLSSVYTFFDTENTQDSFGTFGILWQIEQAKILGLHNVYLGYFIAASPKMSYKSLYQPLEGLVDGKWTKLSF
jgi:arginine-tRNA-protein transferase